jgi:hypothetical protein
MVEKIVETIKERNNDKIIIFTLHQANTGSFDNIIDINLLKN